MDLLHNESTPEPEPHPTLDFMAEREKLHNNIRTFQETSEKLSEILIELEQLYKDHARLQWDIRYLEEKINRTAQSLDLKPLPKKRIETDLDHPKGSA